MAIFGRDGLDPVSLRARLVPHVGRTQAETVAVRAGVFDVVVVTVGEPAREVTLAEVDASGVELREVVDSALGQTMNHELARLDIRNHEITDGRSIRVLAIDGNAFVTLALLMLHRFIDVPSDAGAFVTAPTFDSVAVYPLTARRDTEVLAGLTRISTKIANKSQDVCDPRVHWWDRKTFHEIDMLGSDNRIPVVGGPAGLLAALNSL